jgi:predicted acetylornithine/succinylornithine family transaminase
MKASDYIEDSANYLMDTYRRYPVVMRKGRGLSVWDTDDRQYIDFVGGVATNVLGHCHPKVVMALQKQAQRLLHVSNFYHIGQQAELAKLLVENSFADKVFFCNTGTEANEAAIKLARKWSITNHGPERFEIITALSSFHGRTLGSLAATGQENLKKDFGPMPEGFTHVPFNDIDALSNAISDRTAAILLEPILGEAGVVVPSPGYLKDVRTLCDKAGILLILDEVQTGLGRTGTLFAYEQEDITPDIMTLAKGLGGGIAIGAMLASDQVADAFKPGDHGSTFGGNPLACAAAAATLNTVLDSGILIDQCKRMGDYLTGELDRLKKKYPQEIKEVRGRGLLIGMQMSHECADIVKACMEHGVLLNCTALNVIRFMPPLIVEQQHIDKVVDVLDTVLASF